jgi:peptidoglycan/LPS O-acetylase OafA/YrhL
MDSLILGALVAIAFQSTSNRSKLAKDAPIILLMISFVIGICIAAQPNSPIWNNRAMLTIGLSTLAIFGALLIVFLQTRPEDHFARVFFRNPVLTFFGKYSYALYIFHWPITSLAIAVYGNSGYMGWGMWLFFVGGCYLCTIVAALISWNLVEKHALKLKRYFE